MAAKVMYSTAQEKATQRLKKKTTGSVTRRWKGRYTEMLIMRPRLARSSSLFTFHLMRWAAVLLGSEGSGISCP